MTGNSVNELIWKQFNAQISRGVDGFGTFNGEKIFKTPKLRKMRSYLRKDQNDSDFLMFHHRFPTSTVNVTRAAHPFSTGDFFDKPARKKNGKQMDAMKVQYVLVHNGGISNPQELKAEHEKLGIKYSSTLDNGTFNDSEALLWDFALTMENRQKELKAYGGIAFVAVKLVNGEIESMFWGRNAGRPLKVHKTGKGILISSEGMGQETEVSRLYTYSWSKHRIKVKDFTIRQYLPYTYTPANSKQAGYLEDPFDRKYGASNSCGYGSSSRDAGYDSYGYWTADGEYIEFDEDDFYDDGDSDNIDGSYTYYPYGYKSSRKSNTDLELESYEQEWWLSNLADQKGSLLKKTTLDYLKVYARYMLRAEGVYEHAWDKMDNDLGEFADHQQNHNTRAISEAIEACMKYIQDREEYKSPTSVDIRYVIDKKSKELAKALLVGAKAGV